MDLPNLSESGGKKEPKDKKQQQLMIAGTFALVVIGYLTYRRMKSGSSTTAAATPVDNLAGANMGGGSASGPAYGPTTPTQNILGSIPGLDTGASSPAPAPAVDTGPNRSLLPSYSPGSGNDWFWNYATKAWYAAPSLWSKTHIPGVGPAPAPSTVPAAKAPAKAAAKPAAIVAPKPIAHPAAVAKGAHPATVSGGSNVASHSTASVPLSTPKRVVPHGAVPASML